MFNIDNIMTRSQKFLYNTIVSALYQVIVMAVGFILPRIMLVYYGSELNGLISSITQFVKYFALVEAGLSAATVFALYKPLANANNNQINRILVATRNFYNISGYIFVSLVGILALIYPFFTSTTKLTHIEVGLLVLVLGVNGALEFFTLGKYRAILTADQRSYVISFASIVYYLLSTTIIIVVASLSVNILVVYMIVILAIFVRTLILMIYCKKKYSFMDFTVSPDNSALNKRWSALFLQMLGTIQSATPIIIATIFTSLKSVSVYSIFNMVTSGIMGILDIFMSGLSASFGDVLVRGEKETLEKAYSDFELTYYALITLVYGVSMILIMPFIRIYTYGINDADYNQSILGILFVLNGFLYNIKTPQGMMVISAGLYRETRVQSTIQALIVVIGGIILAPRLGLVGILIASCISNIYRDIDLILFIPKYVTHLPVKNTAMRILRSIIEFTLILVISRIINMNITNWIQWILYSIVALIYSIIVILIISYLFDRKQLKSVLSRIKRMISIKDKIHIAKKYI